MVAWGPFEQLCGAAGDVKELEYVAALHQSDADDPRRNASLVAEDVRWFLSSRYGVVVSETQVRDIIFRGLGSSASDEGATEVLDLMEVVSILFVPTLLKAARQRETEELPEGVVAAPPGMIEYVLKMILHDTTGDSRWKALSPDLLRQIFAAYGEAGLADDEELMEDMVKAASGDSKECHLDVNAFARALTNDVLLYDIANEIRHSTSYEDVFIKEQDSKPFRSIGDTEVASSYTPMELRERIALSHEVEKRFTAPSIDVTAGTYRSKTLMVLVWLTTLITYFAYIFDAARVQGGAQVCSTELGFEYSFNAPWTKNSAVIACDAGASIVAWLFFFLIISIYGLIFVSLSSIGNYVGSPVWKPMVGGTIVFGIVFLLYFYRGQGQSENQYLWAVSLILGCLAAVFHLSHVLVLCIPNSRFFQHSLVKRYLTTSAVTAEMHLKQACAHKVVTMATNALELFRINSRDNMALTTHFAQALGEYERSGKKYRKIGGFKWCWKRIISREAFAQDGIWIGSRLIASNVAQYIVSIYILLAGISLTRSAMANFGEENTKEYFQTIMSHVVDKRVESTLADSLSTNLSSAVLNGFLAAAANSSAFSCQNTSSADYILDTYCSTSQGILQCKKDANISYLCALIDGYSGVSPEQQAALLNASGIDVSEVAALSQASLQYAADQSLDSLYPSERYMVAVPLVVGTVVAFLTAVMLAVTYIPSVTKTVLQCRCGAIPTLHDKDFRRFRVAPDQVSILTGSLFWGALVSSLVVGGVIGSLVFFFLWQATAYFAQRFVAILLGVLAIAIIRLCMVTFCRLNFYQSFYRKRPGAANLTMLALEWANFSLSVSFVFFRMLKLLFVAGACIGRIDRPFLAPGIGRVGRLELDNYPTVHTKDLLSNEAHRHPYIELLGVMYLLKLRYRDHFGCRSGSCWRLLFIYALFPWLHRYRTSARSVDQDATRRDSVVLDPPYTLRDMNYKSIRVNLGAPNGQGEVQDGQVMLSNLPNESESPIDYEDTTTMSVEEELMQLRAKAARLLPLEIEIARLRSVLIRQQRDDDVSEVSV